MLNILLFIHLLVEQVTEASSHQSSQLTLKIVSLRLYDGIIPPRTTISKLLINLKPEQQIDEMALILLFVHSQLPLKERAFFRQEESYQQRSPFSDPQNGKRLSGYKLLHFEVSVYVRVLVLVPEESTANWEFQSETLARAFTNSFNVSYVMPKQIPEKVDAICLRIRFPEKGIDLTSVFVTLPVRINMLPLRIKGLELINTLFLSKSYSKETFVVGDLNLRTNMTLSEDNIINGEYIEQNSYENDEILNYHKWNALFPNEENRPDQFLAALQSSGGSRSLFFEFDLLYKHLGFFQNTFEPEPSDSFSEIAKNFTCGPNVEDSLFRLLPNRIMEKDEIPCSRFFCLLVQKSFEDDSSSNLIVGKIYREAKHNGGRRKFFVGMELRVAEKEAELKTEELDSIEIILEVFLEVNYFKKIYPVMLEDSEFVLYIWNYQSEEFEKSRVLTLNLLKNYPRITFDGFQLVQIFNAAENSFDCNFKLMFEREDTLAETQLIQLFSRPRLSLSNSESTTVKLYDSRTLASCGSVKIAKQRKRKSETDIRELPFKKTRNE